MHLSALWVYPVKGMRGISLREAELDERGIRHDRRWMLVDGRGAFLSQRKHPRLVLIGGELAPDTLRLSAPGVPELPLPLAGPDGPEAEVQIWGDRVRARTYPDPVDRWFGEVLGTPCRLVYMPDDATRAMSGAAPAARAPSVAFNDGYPLHLISEASLADLNRRLASPVSVERFRPNLVVGGAAPYAEDRWRSVRVGGVDLRDVAPCTRCAVTTVDPERGERGREPLRTLASYRMGGDGAEFGRYLAHRGRGALRVGDPVVPG